MWGLIIASSVCGLLFGRYFKIYALIPAALVLAGIAYFLASKQGLAVGALSLVLATVAMQLCYFLSVAIIARKPTGVNGGLRVASSPLIVRMNANPRGATFARPEEAQRWGWLAKRKQTKKEPPG